MGLFGKKKQKQVQEVPVAKAVPAPLQYARMWSMPEPSRSILMSGEMSRNVYVYDFRPFAGVNLGQAMELEAVRGDAAFKNKWGEVWDSRKDYGIPVAFGGVIVGMTRLPKEEIEKAARKGYAVRLSARCDGVLPQYGPEAKEIKAYVNQQFEVEGPIEADRAHLLGAPAQSECYSLRLSKEDEIAPFATRNYWELPNVRFEAVQDEAKAKPLGISVIAEDGKKLMDVSARRKMYKELLEIDGKSSHRAIFAYRRSTNDGTPYYTVHLRYW